MDPVKEDVKVYQQKTVVEVLENPQTEISLEDAKKLLYRFWIRHRHFLLVRYGGIIQQFQKNVKNLSFTTCFEALGKNPRGRLR